MTSQVVVDGLQPLVVARQPHVCRPQVVILAPNDLRLRDQLLEELTTWGLHFLSFRHGVNNHDQLGAEYTPVNDESHHMPPGSPRPAATAPWSRACCIVAARATSQWDCAARSACTRPTPQGRPALGTTYIQHRCPYLEYGAGGLFCQHSMCRGHCPMWTGPDAGHLPPRPTSLPGRQGAPSTPAPRCSCQAAQQLSPMNTARCGREANTC